MTPTNRTDEVSQLVDALRYEDKAVGLTDYDFEVLADNIERIVASQVQRAVAEETERCAVIAETNMVLGKDVPTDQFKGWRIGAEQAAQSIDKSIRESK